MKTMPLLIRTLVGSCLIAFAFDKFCNPVSAAVVDQSYLPTITIGSEAETPSYGSAVGQSFAVGIAGQLDGISILLARDPGVTWSIEFDVFQIVNQQAVNIDRINIPYQNIPLYGNPEGAGSTAATYLSSMTLVDLTSLNILLKQGQEWGFALRDNFGPGYPVSAFYFGGCENNEIVQCNPGNGTYNGYAGGSFIYLMNDTNLVENNPTFSLAFQTEVSPTPVPAALPLFATGLGALGLLGWRRKRKNAAAMAAA
jgi:hypothetical protein